MRKKELFFHVTSGSNVMRNVHWCVTDNNSVSVEELLADTCPVEIWCS